MGTVATLKETRKRTSPKRTAPPPHGAPPNPARIFQTINAFQQSAAMRAAIELDVFTAIGEGQNTVAQNFDFTVFAANQAGVGQLLGSNLSGIFKSFQLRHIHNLIPHRKFEITESTLW